ncbi:uncharacterized protein LOC141615427 [Silene latifolia]|uniref:uncharacterized protein LOC141615427 n=1 Tax=Silene latifolia TaxID=37657 RepID=UPI003D76F17B
MSLTTENVRNRVKIWKKHYGVIMEIRMQTKFKWDEERKMVVIAIEDMPEWMKYTQANPSAAVYSNKSIEHWDDICALVGPDRAVGDGVEHHEEGATMMDEEACDGASSSMDTTSTSSNKKRKRDNLAEAMTSVAHTLKSYVEARLKATPLTLGGKEVYDEVSNVIGILRPEVLKAVSMFIESPVKFQVLKDLPGDQKLDWIIPNPSFALMSVVEVCS